MAMYRVKEKNLTGSDHYVQGDSQRLTKAQRTALLRIQADWSCRSLGSVGNPFSREGRRPFGPNMHTMTMGAKY